jgi:hypothetical protein
MTGGVLVGRGGQIERAHGPERLGDRGCDEGVERVHAELREHGGDLGLVGTDVPGGERVGRGEKVGGQGDFQEAGALNRLPIAAVVGSATMSVCAPRVRRGADFG